MVLWGVIYPHPNPEAKQSPKALQYSHLLMLEWLDTKNRVTGFYIKLKDGTTINFPNTIDPNDDHFTQLADSGPGRYEFIYFSQEEEKLGKQLLKLSPNEFRRIIQDGQANRVGLILRDGTKVGPGPLGAATDYQDKANGSASHSKQ